MIIKIEFIKIEHSEVREAVMAAFDLLGEKGGIFRKGATSGAMQKATHDFVLAKRNPYETGKSRKEG